MLCSFDLLECHWYIDQLQPAMLRKAAKIHKFLLPFDCKSGPKPYIETVILKVVGY